jgi:hypothetical protein
MSDESIVECAFLIPIRRDVLLSDGETHSAETWDKLDDQLYSRFGGGTNAPGLYAGFYMDPDTGQRVSDESKRIIAAIPESRIDELRQLLVEACDWFQQKSIYLSVAGRVEFVSKP